MPQDEREWSWHERCDELLLKRGVDMGIGRDVVGIGEVDDEGIICGTTFEGEYLTAGMIEECVRAESVDRLCR